MSVTFGQLYEGVIALERGINQMEIDIANMHCDYATKCLMEDELANIRGQYDALLDMDIDFQSIDFNTLIYKISYCMQCIEIAVG